MSGVAVSIDMGGTNLRVAIVDEKGEILCRILQPTKPERGRSKVFASLTEGVKEAMVKAKAKGLEPLGVGIGFPGVFADAASSWGPRSFLTGWGLRFWTRSARRSRFRCSSKTTPTVRRWASTGFFGGISRIRSCS